jgi:hypothetical protein
MLVYDYEVRDREPPRAEAVRQAGIPAAAGGLPYGGRLCTIKRSSYG